MISPTAIALVISVCRPWKRVSVTLMFMCFIIWLFTLWVLLWKKNYWKGDETNFACWIGNNAGDCFSQVFSYGIRHSQGIEKWMTPNVSASDPFYYVKLIWATMFWVLIVNIMLRVVTGVFVSTFTNLTNTTRSREETIAGVCMVCGAKEKEFTKKGKSWSHHLKSEHNIWMYLCFMIHIREKAKRSGLALLEEHCWRNLQATKTAWFPIGDTSFLNDKNVAKRPTVTKKKSEQETKATLEHKFIQQNVVIINTQTELITRSESVKNQISEIGEALNTVCAENVQKRIISENGLRQNINAMVQWLDADDRKLFEKIVRGADESEDEIRQLFLTICKLGQKNK